MNFKPLLSQIAFKQKNPFGEIWCKIFAPTKFQPQIPKGQTYDKRFQLV
jgi:hypothetical protein